MKVTFRQRSTRSSARVRTCICWHLVPHPHSTDTPKPLIPRIRARTRTSGARSHISSSRQAATPIHPMIPSADTAGNPPLRTVPSRSSSCCNDEDIDQRHYGGGLGTIQETENHRTHADIGIQDMSCMRNLSSRIATYGRESDHCTYPRNLSRISTVCVHCGYTARCSRPTE